MELQNIYLAIVAGLLRVTDEGSVPEIAQYGPYHLYLNIFTASKEYYVHILFDVCGFENCIVVLY